MRRVWPVFLLTVAALAAAGAAAAADPETPAVRPVSYFVNIAMADNPALDVAWERMRIAKEVGLDQMTRYPEPRPNLQISGVMDVELWEYQRQDMANTLRAEVKMTYAELSSLRMQAGAVRESRDALGEVVEIARRLYAVGKGGQTDVLRSQLEYAKLQEQLLTTENGARLAEVRLNVICGRHADAPVGPVEEPGDFPFPYSSEELFRAFKGERPILTAIQRAIRRGRSMSIEGDRRLLSFLDNEATTLIASGLSTLRTREAQIALYRGTVLPQAEQSFRAAMEGYRVGRVTFPALMESVRDLLAFRRDYFTTLGERHMWRAKLESVVGKEL